MKIKMSVDCAGSPFWDLFKSVCMFAWLVARFFTHPQRKSLFFCLFVFVLPIWAWNRWHNSAHSTVANGTAVGILKAWVLLPQHHHHSTAPQGHQLIMNGASSHSFYFIFFNVSGLGWEQVFDCRLTVWTEIRQNHPEDTWTLVEENQ